MDRSYDSMDLTKKNSSFNIFTFNLPNSVGTRAKLSFVDTRVY